ncbi:MAG: coiled-coil domain-containing protein [Planctomycetota bacterium]
MSTLTKILIVLLTISSIFLCGIVVTYVATAQNYKKNYNSQRAELDSLKKTTADKIEQYNQKAAEKDALENKLNSEIAKLNTEIGLIQGKLKEVEALKKIEEKRSSDMASVVETTSQTSSETTKLLIDTQADLTKLKSEQIKLIAQFDDTSATLLEKLAVIQTLQKEKKQLLEEKIELQNRMDKLLQPTGRTPAPVVAVTPKTEIARPAPVIAEKIGLKGLITAVDTKNKMASISIGTADGVKEGMKFHVTRADKFICDILIIDTDAEEAVGALQLVQEQPRPGDTVTTNL